MTALTVGPLSDQRFLRVVVVGSLLATALAGALTAAAGAMVVALGGLALGLFAAVVWRPVWATYVYLLTLPIISGIPRGRLIPLLRPNEALFALLLAGAALGGYLRLVRGEPVRLRLHPLDGPLAVFFLLATLWPVTSMMTQGHAPHTADLAALLPALKLLALLVLVRATVRTEAQRLRCVRIVLWPAAVISVIAVLQTFNVRPMISFLALAWPSDDSSGLASRGSTTLGSSIATGDYVIIALALLVACGMRGMLGRRERLVLAVVLGGGTLASAQYSAWISALVIAIVLGRHYPALRRRALRFLPVLAVVAVIGAPAFLSRLQFVDQGFDVPRSWLGRWDNLTSFYIPRLAAGFRFVLGISPNAVLRAPETWRQTIFLESGYLWFLWVGGIPLLAGFGWLSVRLLRHAHQRSRDPGAMGAFAVTLQLTWCVLLVLSVIDSHVFLRGTGELLFTLVGVTTVSRGRLLAPGVPPPRIAPAQRALDLLVATLCLAVLAVPMLLVAALVRLTSPGPALFRQVRAGIGRRPFTVYKFRTMTLATTDEALRELIARELRGEDTAVAGSCKLADPRVTPVGRWLRRTSVDELPQLLNVLRGDMSLVGPRPCLEWEAEMFPPEYAERFAVRPGLTGLWQVSGRSRLGTLEMLALDRDYARRRNLPTDLRILAQTLPVLLRGDGAR